MSEKKNINYIANQIDELREDLDKRSKAIEETFDNIINAVRSQEERMNRLIRSLSLTLVLLTGGRVDNSEIEEVRKLATQKGLSIPEMVTELHQKGTLPPSLKKIVNEMESAMKMLTA